MNCVILGIGCSDGSWRPTFRIIMNFRPPDLLFRGPGATWQTPPSRTNPNFPWTVLVHYLAKGLNNNNILATDQLLVKRLKPFPTRAGSLAVRTGSWTNFLTSCLHSQQLLF